MNLGIGDAGAYTLKVARSTSVPVGTFQFTHHFSVYMGDTITLDNPAEFTLSSTTTGDTVVVNGWYIRTIPLNPVYL